MKNPLTLIALSVCALLASTPAFAGVIAVRVPEPMSMSLLAGGVLAIVAAKRMRRK